MKLDTKKVSASSAKENKKVEVSDVTPAENNPPGEKVYIRSAIYKNGKIVNNQVITVSATEAAALVNRKIADYV
ncbi:MAG: hypothetical protein HQK53_18260 [Oligoflexia bacterium]|nr:hypothetical protein [Oligoflexia bacterium]